MVDYQDVKLGFKPTRISREKRGQILDFAIKLIDEVGWIKGASRSPAGYCMMGAVMEACSKYDAYYSTIEECIRKTVHGDPVTFNDHLATNKSQIIDVLKKAKDADC